MIEFQYDEEAVYQDADILQAQYEAEGNRLARLREQGICTHGSWLGKGNGQGPLEGGAYYPEQIGLVGFQVLCTYGCGQVFESEADLHDAAVEAMS